MSRVHDTSLQTVGLVSGGHLLSHMYILTLPPLFPFLRDDFGLSSTQLGILISSIYVLMIGIQPLLGSLVDRIGAKYILVGALFITGSSVITAGFATGYYVLLLCALGIGLGNSGFHPANYPLLDVVSAEDTQGKVFAVHMFMGYVGFAIAPLAVGGLALLYNWRIALIIVGIVGILYAFVTLITLRPIYRAQLSKTDSRSADNDDDGETSDASPSSIHDDLSVLMSPRILALFFLFALIGMISTSLQTFTPLYVFEVFQMSESLGNTTLTVHMAVAAVGVLLGGVLDDRFRSKRIIVGTMALGGATLGIVVLNVLPDSTVLLVALFGFTGLFYGISLPSRDSLVTIYSPDHATGRAFGITSAGIPLGGATAPALLGFVIDTISITLAFGLIVGFFITASLLTARIG